MVSSAMATSMVFAAVLRSRRCPKGKETQWRPRRYSLDRPTVRCSRRYQREHRPR
jgi:hypothetical protein